MFWPNLVLRLTEMCVCIHRCVYLGMRWAVKGIYMVVEMCQAGHLAKSCSLTVSSLGWVPLGAAHHFSSGLWWYLFLRPNYCLLWPCTHVSVLIRVYVCVFVCVCIYIYGMCVMMCICIYLYLNVCIHIYMNMYTLVYIFLHI